MHCAIEAPFFSQQSRSLGDECSACRGGGVIAGDFVGKEKQTKNKVFGWVAWDIRDPDVRISRTKTLCKWPFSVVLDREWPGSPGIWVGTSQIWKNFRQENSGLIFRSLLNSADCKRGGKGPRQKRQKSSKGVKKFFDTFRQFSRRAKNVKNRQKKRQKVFRHFSRGTIFAAPFWGALIFAVAGPSITLLRASSNSLSDGGGPGALVVKVQGRPQE